MHTDYVIPATCFLYSAPVPQPPPSEQPTQAAPLAPELQQMHPPAQDNKNNEALKMYSREINRIKDHIKKGEIKPPVKNASAYIIFGREMRSQLAQENPNLKVVDTVRQVARCWKIMSASQRQRYVKEAKKGERHKVH